MNKKPPLSSPRFVHRSGSAASASTPQGSGNPKSPRRRTCRPRDGVPRRRVIGAGVPKTPTRRRRQVLIHRTGERRVRILTVDLEMELARRLRDHCGETQRDPASVINELLREHLEPAGEGS